MTNRLRALETLRREIRSEEAKMKTVDWMLRKVEQAMQQEEEETFSELEEYYRWYSEHYDREAN